MGLVFMIVVGGILGLLATFMQRTLRMHGLQANVAAGLTGSLAAGLIIGPELGLGTLLCEPYTPQDMLLVTIGAIKTIALVAIYRQMRLR